MSSRVIGVHFSQLNRFCVNLGNALFGEPISCLAVPSLTSMIRLRESGLCWLNLGGVQGSTADLEGKRADVMHEVRQRGPLSLRLERWFLYRRRIGSGIL